MTIESKKTFLTTGDTESTEKEETEKILNRKGAKNAE